VKEMGETTMLIRME
jgi:hypothetical protein